MCCAMMRLAPKGNIPIIPTKVKDGREPRTIQLLAFTRWILVLEGALAT